MAEKQSFMRVDEVAQELGVSKSYAYKIVQKLNAELKNLFLVKLVFRFSSGIFFGFGRGCAGRVCFIGFGVCRT